MLHKTSVKPLIRRYETSEKASKVAFEALASAKIYVSDSRGYAVNYPWHACKWHKIKVS